VHIGRGRSVLATAPDGLIGAEHPDHGPFVHETRMLSRWRYSIDGEPPSPNAFSAVRQNHWAGYFVIAAPGVTPPPKDDGSGQVPDASRNSLELRVTRLIDDGVHEDLDLTNYTTETTTFVFAIELDGDFADQAETRTRQQHGERTVHWDAEGRCLTFDYVAHNGSATLHRSLELAVERATTAPSYVEGRLSFAVTLAPKERWHACLLLTAIVDGERLPAPAPSESGDCGHRTPNRWLMMRSPPLTAPHPSAAPARTAAGVSSADARGRGTRSGLRRPGICARARRRSRSGGGWR
jgi:hypothetical protein